MGKRKYIFVIGLALIFSLNAFIANYMHYHKSTVFTLATATFLCTILFGVGIMQLSKAVSVRGVFFDNTKARLTDRQFFFIFWGVTFAVWFLVLLVLYPGVFGYDAPGQLYELLIEGKRNLHHPIAHTSLLAFFIAFLGGIFNNYDFGLMLYIVFQLILLSHAVARIMAMLKKYELNVIEIVILFFLTAFNPYVIILNVNATKDVIFSAFFVEFILSLLNILNSGKKGKAALAEAVVWGLFATLFRNQMIYILIVSAVFVFLISKEKRKHVLAAFLMISIVAEVIKAVLVCGFSFSAPKVSEMLSVPMQQVVRVVNKGITGEESYVSITDEEILMVEEVITVQGIQAYDETIADPVKAEFNTGKFMLKPWKHIINYLKIGTHNPLEYSEGFLAMISPYWDMQWNSQRGLSLIIAQEYANVWEISSPNKDSALYRMLANMVNDISAYGSNGFLSIIFNPGSLIWIMLGLLWWAVTYRQKDIVFIMMFPLLYFGTNLLGPVALIRYLVPLMYVVPLSFGLVFARVKARFKNSEQ